MPSPFKPLRYEVDLSMLPEGAAASDLSPFCRVLEWVLEEDGDDLVRIVETFQALNDPTDSRLVLWGWPTQSQWESAIARHFGVIPLFGGRLLSLSLAEN